MTLSHIKSNFFFENVWCRQNEEMIYVGERNNSLRQQSLKRKDIKTFTGGTVKEMTVKVHQQHNRSILAAKSYNR